MTVVSHLPSDQMLYLASCKNTIWILFAEHIKLWKTAMNSSQNDNLSRYSAHPITAASLTTQAL